MPVSCPQLAALLSALPLPRACTKVVCVCVCVCARARALFMRVYAP